MSELLYSLSSGTITPFSGGFLCMGNPIRRSQVNPNIGGTVGNCDATVAFDMNQFAQTAPNADPGLLIPGTQVWAQFWGRDNGSLFLSDALNYTVAP